MSKKKILFILFLIFCLCFTFIKMVLKNKNNTNENIQPIEEVPLIQPIEEIPTEPETYTSMYAITNLNIREQPTIESKIIKTVDVNTEFQVVNNSENNDWVKVKIDNNYYFVSSKYLSIEKIKIKTTKKNTSINGVLTKSKGVNYFNGHRETWYSQRVLPGGGLKIPGRHVDERGIICDGDGFISVASSDYSKGTIVETSLGTGKVYDSGCPSGTIDIYCDW